MSKEKDYAIYAHHIKDAINLIRQYVGSMSYDMFIKDRKTQDTVIRELQIIGEAAKRIPDAVREKHIGIPWKDITGMRDKLVHDYFGIDNDMVWDVMTKDIPMLEKEIIKLL